MKSKHRFWLVILALLGMGLGPSAATAATEVTIVVDSLADAELADNNCTLREAVQAANSNMVVDGCAAGSPVARDTITFSLDGTIFLSSELVVGGGITIQGNGQDKTILDGQRVTRVIRLNGIGRGEIRLRNLTIQNGYATGTNYEDGLGGGIYGSQFPHSLLLEQVIFQSNEAERNGGGLYAIPGFYESVVTIRSSTFLDNAAHEGDGGALVTASDIPCSASVVIENSLFKGNVATGSGGAISAYCNSLTISRSTLSANQSELADGFAGGGAIYASQGTVTVINSTLSGNEDENGRGAIFAYTAEYSILVQIRNSTIVGNAPANLHLRASAPLVGTAVFADSLVGNHGAINCDSSWGDGSPPPTITSLGFNLTDSDDCGFDEATDIQISPLALQRSLGSLQDNGGPTPTMALRASSPAID